MADNDFLRLPAEQLYADEISAIKSEDLGPIPEGWQMSPRGVLKFIVGGSSGGINVTPKYIGNNRLVEVAIATLLTDRALLLIDRKSTRLNSSH